MARALQAQLVRRTTIKMTVLRSRLLPAGLTERQSQHE